MNRTASSLKKTYERRLVTITSNNISSTPIRIKIEDESEDENDSIFTTGTIKNVVTSSDKYVQTDAFVLEEMLGKVVKDRMEQYELAVINKQFNDAQLSPMLEKLHQENKELRKHGMQLQLELQKRKNENKTLKRRFEHMSCADASNLTSTVTSQLASQPNTPVNVNNITLPSLRRSPSSFRPAHPSIHLRQSSSQATPGILMFGANQQRVLVVNQSMDNKRSNISATPNKVNIPPTLFQKIIQQRSEQQPQQQYQPQEGPTDQQTLIRIQRSNATTLSLAPLLTRPTLPKLRASITTAENTVVLTWDYYGVLTNEEKGHFKVKHFQLLAHQGKEASSTPPKYSALWKKIGKVNAFPLPMACTLTQFANGACYFFAVVAVDAQDNEGEMSNHCVIRLDINDKG